jgi:hypothetical protein
MPISAMARLMTLDFSALKVNIDDKHLPRPAARLTIVDRLAIVGTNILINHFAQFGYRESSSTPSADAGTTAVSVTVFTCIGATLLSIGLLIERLVTRIYYRVCIGEIHVGVWEFRSIVLLERVQEEHIGAREAIARWYISGIQRGWSQGLLQWGLSLGSLRGQLLLGDLLKVARVSNLHWVTAKDAWT